MAGYWVVRGSAIKDEAAFEEYAKMWPPIGQRYGAELLAGKGAIDTREGPEFKRHLIIRFASYEQALACYEDPDYQAAMEFALKAYDRELVILDGD